LHSVTEVDVFFKDLIREFYKKYEVLLMILFLAYLIFLVSEGLLFISFFWGTFHSLSSPNYGMCPAVFQFSLFLFPKEVILTVLTQGPLTPTICIVYRSWLKWKKKG
jgi:hypothetical protein